MPAAAKGGQMLIRRSMRRCLNDAMVSCGSSRRCTSLPSVAMVTFVSSNCRFLWLFLLPPVTVLVSAELDFAALEGTGLARCRSVASGKLAAHNRHWRLVRHRPGTAGDVCHPAPAGEVVWQDARLLG